MPNQPAVPELDDYAQEVRFGVVMYGGVSLAMYINGVAGELYEMAAATPKRADDPRARPRDAGPAPARTRDVYRKLSWLIANPALKAAYLAHADGRGDDPFADDADLSAFDRTRLVVDVIAGTSAGGINGVFLAKALANGQAFEPLKRMWVQEGDIASLLNDDASYEGIRFAKTNSPPQSLLNSDRMYVKLQEAMEAMTAAIPPVGRDESPLVDELDLYVTTTDIRGAVVPLRLFDDVVHEKRHKQVYHFQYAGADGIATKNDFRDENTPFLAFAARCTSSFPFAFEPMQVVDAERLNQARLGGGSVDFGHWKTFFKGLSADDLARDRWRTRAFGDGGYLDNKPFSYVVEALSWRLATVPMERKLVYIEPAPSHPEREQQSSAAKPNAIENALAALTSIPQYESIREDLEAVLARNRRIERVERIVRKVEEDIELSEVDPFARVMVVGGKVPTWSDLDMGDLIAYYGVAFLPYRRARLASVNDDIADRLADWWQVDRGSDRLYAMRALVRAWREERFFEHRERAAPTQTRSVNAFLAEFDMKYRVRRVGFLLRKTHQLLRLATHLALPEDRRTPLSDVERRLLERLTLRRPELLTLSVDGFIDALERLRFGLGRAMAELRRIAWPKTPVRVGEADARHRAQLDRVLRSLIGEDLDPPLTELSGVDGRAVDVPAASLPLPSRSRTLQENVFARAQGLFALARAGRRTELQQLLEDDIATLAALFASATAAAPAAAAGEAPLRARDLLGAPRLKAAPGPEKAADPAAKGAAARPPVRVVIEVDPVDEARCGAALNTPQGRLLREFMAEYYLRFDEYDQMSFPLYYGTDTGEPSTVEVLRVSPEDAVSLINERRDAGRGDRPRHKLAGSVLFNFGGFLDAQWRRNDIMWGRLDGCERLLTALLPEAADDALRRALLGEAQRTILTEEMHPDGYAELVRRFAQALAAQPQSTLKQAFDALWGELAPPEEEKRTRRIATALEAVLGEQGMVDYVRKYYEVNRDLDVKAQMKTASRALTITGLILEQIEKTQRAGGSRAVWITRGGRAFQALLAASTPGGFGRLIWHHWLALLYLFAVVLFVGTIVFPNPGVHKFALGAFVLTLLAQVLTLLLGDEMARPRRGWKKIVLAGVGAALLALAVLGTVGLVNVGPRGLVCDATPPPGERPGWIGRQVCRP